MFLFIQLSLNSPTHGNGPVEALGNLMHLKVKTITYRLLKANSRRTIFSLPLRINNNLDIWTRSFLVHQGESKSISDELLNLPTDIKSSIRSHPVS